MSTYEKISDFLTRVRRRINMTRFLAGVCWGVMAASLGVFAVALGYVLCGYAVDMRWLAVPVIAGAVFALGWFDFRRLDTPKAAVHADRFFDLHDSLVSSLRFHEQGRLEGIYDLQAQQTADAITGKQIKTIRYRWPVRWLCVAAVLLSASVALCMLDNSPAVKLRLQQEQETAQRSEEISKYLKKQYEELEKRLNEEQKELLKKTDLKKKIDEFEKTKDRKEAMRKLAVIEKQLRKLSAQAAVKKDQKFLKRLAAEMSKNKDTKKLAAELAGEKYKQAAETVRDKKSDKMKKEGKTPEEIKEMMKKLARQMSQSCDKSASQQGDVEQAACEFASSTDRFEDDNFDEQDGKLGELSDKLEQLDTKCDFSEQMEDMAEKLGECQNFCMGLGKCDKPGMGIGESQSDKNGKGIGSAAKGNTRKGDGKKDPRGKYTEIKGKKGQGPTYVSVSEASSGSGVSGRKGDAKVAKAFESQVENFVHREDVPENLKGGVKKYFEIIHNENVSDKEKP